MIVIIIILILFVLSLVILGVVLYCNRDDAPDKIIFRKEHFKNLNKNYENSN